MTVVLLEPGLNALLELPTGPVALLVNQISDEIAAEAKLNVQDYFKGAPTMNVHDDVATEAFGETVAVGIRNVGNKSRRMADYQAQGKVNWLGRAVEIVRIRRAAGG